MKPCTICKQQKPLTEFHSRPSASDGRHSHCAACHNAAGRQRRQQHRAEEQARRAAQARNQCLHAGCHQPGEHLPQGVGFRFCDDHAPIAQAVLAGKPVPKNTAPVQRGRKRNCNHPLTAWNRLTTRTGGVEYHKCKACQRARNLAQKQPWINKKALADSHYNKLKKEHTAA